MRSTQVILIIMFYIIPILLFITFFFFSSRRRHTRFDCDWSSDVCSSDLSVKHQRTDSLKQAGVTDSVKIDSILAADTLKDEDRPWPRRPPAAPRVANKAGLNMFAWNMRYPDAVAFWGMVGVGTDGPMALPGVYQG